MAKLNLSDVASGYNRQRINQNFQDIETELNDKVLYRNNPTGEPNQMENDLDMNSNDILNAKDTHTDRLILDGTIITAVADLANIDAVDVNYDNTTSGLTAIDVQAAVDELGVTRVKSVASIADLFGLVGVDGQQINARGYQPTTTVGGGGFAWG